jgi:RNA recognition motif-containing protein
MMPRFEYSDFYNDGFGFVCKHCERELKAAVQTSQTDKHSRLMREGEAETFKSGIGKMVGQSPNHFDLSKLRNYRKNRLTHFRVNNINEKSLKKSDWREL